jgi:biopolymer transport protein TolR
MSMAVGPSGGQNATINVTPLIDVLLVLLIIFMVIPRPTPQGLDAMVPQPPPPNQKQDNTPDRTIVVQIIDRGAGQEPGLMINSGPGADTTWDALQGRLTDIYKTRAEKVMFVKGDDNIPFADVANVIDIAHASGVDKVGLITAKIESGG